MLFWENNYTVSVIERNIGYAGYTTKGVIVFDLQTGDFEEYSLEEMPSWIDRGVPLDVLDAQLKAWGDYKNGGFYFWNPNQTSQGPTNGWYMVYGKDGSCKWFSGWTSMDESDQALTGFSLSDARTGKTIFYKTSGVTEEIAYKIAFSHWSNFKGYIPEELVVYNVFGKLTYIMPIAFENNFVGVSLVSTENKEINAMGETPEQAFANYRRAISKKGGANYAPGGGEILNQVIIAKILEIGIPFNEGSDQVFPFRIKGEDKIFEASYSRNNAEVPFMKPGRNVRITFMQTNEKIISCETFDILDIILTEDNPNQARFDEHKDISDKERKRIRDIQTKNQLLNSSDLKEVDSEALEQFLREQKKNKK